MKYVKKGIKMMRGSEETQKDKNSSKDQDFSSTLRGRRSQRHQLTPRSPQPYVVKHVQRGIKRMHGREDTQKDKNSSKDQRSAATANSSPVAQPRHDFSSTLRVRRSQRHQLTPRSPQPRSAPTANSTPATPPHHDFSSKLRVSRSQRRQLTPWSPQPYILKRFKKGTKTMRGSEETQEDKNSSKDQRSAPTANSTPAPPPHRDFSSTLRVSRSQRHQLSPRSPQPYVLKRVKKGTKTMGGNEETQKDKYSSKDQHSAPTAKSTPAPPPHHDFSSTLRVSRSQRQQLTPRSPQPYLLKRVKKGTKTMGGSEAYAEQKKRATRTKKEIHPKQSPKSGPPKYQPSGPTANSSPAAPPDNDSLSTMRVSRKQHRRLPIRRSQLAEETSVQEDAPYAEQKERATRAKKEIQPKQSPKSGPRKYQPSGPTANSSPAAPPDNDFSSRMKLFRRKRHQFPPRRPQPDSSSTMKVSGRKRRRPPPRRPQPHCPLIRSMTKPHIAMTRARGRL